jgi:hypothetical protein
MKHLALFAACLVLAGCMASSGSPKDLKASTERVHRICHDQSPRETFDLLSRKMSACYLGKDIAIPIQAGAVFTSVSTQTRIDALFRENGRSEISVSMQGGLAPRIYGEHVEISQTSACPAQVEVFILNTFWEKRAAHIKSWLQGESVDCTYM